MLTAISEGSSVNIAWIVLPNKGPSRCQYCS